MIDYLFTLSQPNNPVKSEASLSRGKPLLSNDIRGTYK